MVVFSLAFSTLGGWGFNFAPGEVGVVVLLSTGSIDGGLAGSKLVKIVSHAGSDLSPRPTHPTKKFPITIPYSLFSNT